MPRPTKRTPENLEAVRGVIERGGSLREAALAAGISPGTVGAWVAEFDWRPRLPDVAAVRAQAQADAAAAQAASQRMWQQRRQTEANEAGMSAEQARRMAMALAGSAVRGVAEATRAPAKDVRDLASAAKALADVYQRFIETAQLLTDGATANVTLTSAEERRTRALASVANIREAQARRAAQGA